MKKKVVAACMTVALAAVAMGGATLAYFQDADKDVNVMTTGNLQIVQNETERDGSAYVDGQTLLPAVYFDEQGDIYTPTASWMGPTGPKTDFVGPDGENHSLYAENIKNEIDKIVSVTNRGNQPAYVRTIVLLEDTDDVSDEVHIVYSDTDVCAREIIDQVKIGEEYYEAWVFTYNAELGAGKTSKASLKQLWLDPNADDEWYKGLGADGKFTVVALSQAAQVAGFENATQALDTAFGDVNAANIAKWVAETDVIKTSDENNVVGGALD